MKWNAGLFGGFYVVRVRRIGVYASLDGNFYLRVSHICNGLSDLCCARVRG